MNLPERLCNSERECESNTEHEFVAFIMCQMGCIASKMGIGYKRPHCWEYLQTLQSCSLQ